MLLLKSEIFDDADHETIHVVSIQTRESLSEDAEITESELQKESSKIIKLNSLIKLFIKR